MLFLQLLPSDPPPPENWFYPIVLPLLLAAGGAYAYFRGTLMESYGSKAPYRVLGIPLCAIALILGLFPFYKFYSDPLFQNIITSGKVRMAHQYAPFLGAIGLGAIFYDRRRRSMEKRKDDLFDRIGR